jgi:hypothetical protein
LAAFFRYSSSTLNASVQPTSPARVESAMTDTVRPEPARVGPQLTRSTPLAPAPGCPAWLPAGVDCFAATLWRVLLGAADVEVAPCPHAVSCTGRDGDESEHALGHDLYVLCTGV